MLVHKKPVSRKEKISKILFWWKMLGEPDIFETSWVKYEIENNIAVWDEMAEHYAKKLSLKKEDLYGYYYPGSKEYNNYNKRFNMIYKDFIDYLEQMIAGSRSANDKIYFKRILQDYETGIDTDDIQNEYNFYLELKKG